MNDRASRGGPVEVIGGAVGFAALSAVLFWLLNFLMDAQTSWPLWLRGVVSAAFVGGVIAYVAPPRRWR